MSLPANGGGFKTPMPTAAGDLHYLQRLVAHRPPDDLATGETEP